MDEEQRKQDFIERERRYREKLAGPTSQPTVPPVAQENGVRVYFSPRGGCTDAIVAEIERARGSVKVQAYRLTSTAIAKAMLEAHKRGVMVTVLLDKSQQSAKYSDATFFHNQGVSVLIDRDHAIAHNKTMIIDGTTIITGSFNFSQAAEDDNAETLLVIDGSPAIAAAFLQNFEDHQAHCVEYVPPVGTAGE